MRVFQKFGTTAAVMLLVTAAALLYVAASGLVRLRPAADYEDRGVKTFYPYQVLPVQEKNRTSYERDLRMNPYKTVYYVYYRADDGSGYQYQVKVSSKDDGQRVVKEKAPVSRRVLSSKSAKTYITTEPENDAKSYVAGQRGRYLLAGGAALLMLALAAVGWLTTRRRG